MPDVTWCPRSNHVRLVLAALVWALPACGGTSDEDGDGQIIITDDVRDDAGDAMVVDVADAEPSLDGQSDAADSMDDDGLDDVADNGVDANDAGSDITDPGLVLPEQLLAVDMVLEAGGESALITTQDGFVVRVDTATLQMTDPLASGLMGPAGIVLERDGGSALILERDAGRLSRLTLGSGQVTTLAEGLDYPQGVAISPDGAFAFITEGTALSRVTLADGSREVVSAVIRYAKDVVLESDGETLLVLEPGQLTRVDIASGVATTVITEQAVAQGTFRGALALQQDGRTVLLNTDIGCMVRVDLSSETSERIGCLFENDQMALAVDATESWALLGTDDQIMRVHLRPSIERLWDSTSGTEWLALEEGGASVLVLSSAALVVEPRVHRLTLEDGRVEPVASMPEFIAASGLALEPGGSTVLTIGQRNIADVGVLALMRIDLETAAETEISRDIEQCYGSDVAVIEAGAAVLIPCISRLYRVDLTSGAVTVVAAGLDVGGVAVSSDGSWAVFSTMGGRELWKVELPGGEPVRIGHNLFGSNPAGTGCTDLAIEADERSVLVTQTGLYGGPYALTGRVVRVDLATGAVSVLVPGGLDAPGTFTCGTVGIALEPGGATALIAEYHHGVARVSLPTP